MVYWASLYLFKVITRVFFRGKGYNKNALPEKGPYIAIINHNSLLDILALSLVVHGRVVTMVKHSLFGKPILGWWLRAVGMFPIERGAGDDSAFHHALEQLKRGRSLYMAPEGTRKYSSESPPKVHTGFVRLAQLADCPVVPIALTGTREALPPGAKLPRLVKIRAMVGAPISFEKAEVSLENIALLQHQATEAMSRVYELKAELESLNHR